ncbi:MAG: hypothetical protein RBR47_04070 [Bacteroidales bacterium]|jgi:predicted transport protein|nr:hypothetical protein [Bacteroidales bacterium]NCU35691.1 hypothetical protein [Candidatus Falkowbacteria bacterium]MDD2632524.1 hypothetical protein [Bacteroidales bacterium]MDD3130897.1 hypothetical protein [Bacteroidales bacterium]MDD3528041.1 hypothetical protein [Bacteroidales bacterium]
MAIFQINDTAVKRIKPSEFSLEKDLQCLIEDVRNIGHFGTGDLEFSIRNAEDFEIAKPLIELSLKNIGG